MKRAGDLWGDVTSFENLVKAAHAAATGKRRRPDVADFQLNLEGELLQLRRELVNRSYRPGAYRTFTVQDPKPRHISAAPFRDRVVHHAFTRIVEPIFERRFSENSFACRRGFGTHRALERAKEGARLYPYVLKCDVRKYFASIDHEILKGQLAGVVKCRPTLELAAKIIDGSNEQEPVVSYFPGDDLFTPFERRRGLPLGNQTSQFLSNVYLDALDHFVIGEFGPGVYARYVDDVVVFDDSKDRLREILHAVRGFLLTLRLDLHAGKSRIHRTADGVSFLGWRVFRERCRLDRGNVARFRRRMRTMERDSTRGAMALEDIQQRVQAWIAHAAHGNTWKLREGLLAQFAFTEGRAV